MIVGIGIWLGSGLPVRAQGAGQLVRGLPVLRRASETARVVPQLERTLRGAVVHDLLGSGKGKFHNSVLYARNGVSNTIWTGAVFGVNEGMHQGIYGVIPAHALALFPSDFVKQAAAAGLLRRNFKLNMFDRQGVLHTLSGRVVWLSSPHTWDLALVQFEPSDEELFTPFELKKDVPSIGETVQQLGFSNRLSIYIPQQPIVGVTPFSFRTQLPAGCEEYTGLCGSPVFVSTVTSTEEEIHKLVGVYTGGERGETSEYDVGYFTPSYFVSQLVADYRAGGKMRFPVLCQGRELFSMAIDEHIHTIDLFDSDGVKINQYKFDKKPFSSQELESLLQTFKPEKVSFNIKRFRWAKSDPEYVEFSRDSRKVVYDFVHGQVVK